jgi:hypothetical protein
MLADSMSQKSSCDKFLGERLCERIGTLRSNGALVVSSVLIIVFDLVWYRCCMGEVNIGWDKSAGLLFSEVLAGAFESPGVSTF